MTVYRRWFSRRSIIAALLALLYPGLGHVYLRAWLRAIAWFVVALVAAGLVMPESMFVAYESEGLTGVLEASRNLPSEAILSLLIVRGLNAIDAYLTGLEVSAEPTEAGTRRCPSCGREVDSELDFCQWCATELDEADEADEVTVR